MKASGQTQIDCINLKSLSVKLSEIFGPLGVICEEKLDFKNCKIVRLAKAIMSSYILWMGQFSTRVAQKVFNATAREKIPWKVNHAVRPFINIQN